jgi:hypothetical protein
MNQTVGTDWRNPTVKLTMTKPLPPSLTAVATNVVRQRPRIQDPATAAPYGYQVVSESKLRLCASFDTARDEPGDVAWNHPAGWHCFNFDVLSPTR